MRKKWYVPAIFQRQAAKWFRHLHSQRLLTSWQLHVQMLWLLGRAEKKIDTISIPFRYIYWILFFTPYYRVRVRSGFAFQVGSSILFRNGIYLPNFSDLCEKNFFLVIKKHFWNWKLKAKNLQNFCQECFELLDVSNSLNCSFSNT